MTRSRYAAVAISAIAALTLTACGSSSLSTDTPSASKETDAMGSVDEALVAKLPQSVKDAGVIKIGTDASYAPNEYLDADGKTVVGMDVDLFNAVAAQFGMKTEYVPSGFDSIILGVNSGKFDAGVSSFTINEKRLKQVSMVSYFNAGTQWVTAKGNPKGVDPDNACGLNIGVQKGTVQAEDDLPARSKKCTDAGKKAINIIQDGDQGKVTASVVSGKTVAMLADSPIGLYAVKQSPDSLEPLGDIYDAAPYGFVVPKDQTDFADAIATALQNVAKSGEYAKILEKWGNSTGAVSDFAVNPGS